MKINKKVSLLLLVTFSIFLLFNAVVFLVAAISNVDLLSPAVIITWGFSLLGFLSFFIVANSNMGAGINTAKFLGITIIKYCTIYLIIDLALVMITLIVSLFTKMPWIIILPIELIFFLAYLVFIALCTFTKQQISEVSEKIVKKTAYMNMLKADAAVLADYCQDPAEKTEFAKFAEDVKYSDPVSCPELEAIEERLSDLVLKIKAELTENKIEEAKADCKMAAILLKERNTKCKALKRG